MDEDARIYEHAEARLKEWGRACHEAEEAAGRAPSGGLAKTIAHVQAETNRQQKAQKEIKTALRKARKAWKEGDPPIDARLVAEALGYTNPKLTAQGTDARSARLAKITLDTRIIIVDRIIARLPSWQRKCIWRSFYYRQRDRDAASDLKMRLPEYSVRKRAAVHAVAVKLDLRASSRSEESESPQPKVGLLPRRPILTLPGQK